MSAGAIFTHVMLTVIVTTVVVSLGHDWWKRNGRR